MQLPSQTLVALELLLDGMTNSIIEEEDVQKEKEVISNEELENRNNPSQYIWQLGDQGLWPNSTVGRSILGDPESIRNITLPDITDFKGKYYQPSNAVFVVVSNDTFEVIQDAINKVVSKSNQPPLITKQSFSNPTPLLIEERDLGQTTISLNWRTASIDEHQKVSIDFIRDYLANNWISRLNSVLRVERGMTYWVEGESNELSDTGYLRLMFSVNPKDVNESIAIALKEIANVQTKPLSDRDIQDYAAALMTNFTRKNLTPGDIAYWYGWFALLQAPLMTFEQYIESIQKITAKQIQDAAATMLTKNNLSIAMVGPVAKESG